MIQHAMSNLNAWLAILAVVLSSSAGDVLLSRAMKKIGDLGQDVNTASAEFLDWLSFTHPFNCTGQPAMSLPLATSTAGLPIGIQLVGRPRDEYSILSLGAQLEAAVKPSAAVARSG